MTTEKLRSDALVFYGATGDLAYKKIFPALQAMAKRGHLDVPVIGVAVLHCYLPSRAPTVSRCPPNSNRIADSTRSANSASPRELKR